MRTIGFETNTVFKLDKSKLSNLKWDSPGTSKAQ